MSLVGTRPPTVDEWEQYELHHRSRMSTKPGITGMWQVSGRSDITDFEEVVKLDTKYIDEWSLGVDVKILVENLVVVYNFELGETEQYTLQDSIKVGIYDELVIDFGSIEL